MRVNLNDIPMADLGEALKCLSEIPPGKTKEYFLSQLRHEEKNLLKMYEIDIAGWDRYFEKWKIYSNKYHKINNSYV